MRNIEKLSLEELWVHHRAATGLNRGMNVLGVLLIFGTILFYNTITLIVGSISVYIVAKITVGIVRTIEIIEDRIVSLTDK